MLGCKVLESYWESEQRAQDFIADRAFTAKSGKAMNLLRSNSQDDYPSMAGSAMKNCCPRERS